MRDVNACMEYSFLVQVCGEYFALHLSQIWKSLESGHWLEEEPYEMADEFPAARVRLWA